MYQISITAPKLNYIDALNVAEAFWDFLITVGGTFVENVQAFTIYGFAASAYDVYEAFVGPVAYGSPGDKIHTMVWYDFIDKITDVNLGLWYAGSRTGKVWLNTQETFQSYAALARTYTTTESLNKEIYSENFSNAAATATQWFLNYLWIDGDIKMKVHSTNLILWQ